MRWHSYKNLKFDCFKKELDILCSDIPAKNILNSNTKVVTFGSCFASNVARTFETLGISARSVELVEYINTPLANKFYLQTALGEVSFEEGTDVPSPISATSIKSIGEILSKANIIIFTVGVGFVWVKKSNNKFVILPDINRFSNYKTSYLPLSSQVKILQEIIELVRRFNSTAQIWFTLSPVPLEFSLNYLSAVVSDCVSKSILRTAIHEALIQGADFKYFPAFEFFRWLSGHFDRRFYGADGKVRHVDDDLVELVVRKFISLNDGSELHTLAQKG
jgi:hypothetical protein